MRKFGCLLCLMMLAMVFCPSIWGEIITEIKDGKIIMFEKTIIKEGVLPDKSFGISSEIAKELFSGQKAKHIFDQKIITDIDFFNWSFFPKPIGKIITTRVIYSKKVGWITEVLKEKPTIYPLKLVDKIGFGLIIGASVMICWMLGTEAKNMRRRTMKSIFFLILAFCVGIGVSLFLHLLAFFNIFGGIAFFSVYLWWSIVNVIVVIVVCFLLKFGISWNKNRIREKEKMEDKKRQQDSVQKTIRWIGQKHRD